MDLPVDVVELLGQISKNRTTAVVALVRTDPRYLELAAEREWSFAVPTLVPGGAGGDEPAAETGGAARSGGAARAADPARAVGACQACGAAIRGAGLCLDCAMEGGEGAEPAAEELDPELAAI